MTTNQLSGQVAIVTGGGRGFGQAIAKTLAANGAAVTVTSRTQSQAQETAAAIEAAGGRALALQADVNSQQTGSAWSGRRSQSWGP